MVQAAAQTVKILGQAPSCQAGLEGSGFAFAPGRVLTNAHVVAGVKSVQVVTEDGSAVDGEVVYFDPDMDLAVIDAPQLTVRPLKFSDSAARGDSVAVIGYPENGGLEATPARIRDEVVAPGNDIYGEGTVVREVLSLRADVRPGNSGGPVVNKDGDVVGVVFAASLDQDDTGYAMTSRQVASAVAKGLSAEPAGQYRPLLLTPRPLRQGPVSAIRRGGGWGLVYCQGWVLIGASGGGGPGHHAGGVELNVPSGGVFEAVVPPAQHRKVGRRCGAVRPGNGVVEVGAGAVGGAAAAGEPAGHISGTDSPVQRR